jgi:hypothetical protein
VHADFVVNTVLGLPRLVARFIEAFINPDQAFGTKTVLLHGKVEENRGFPLVQQPFGLVGALLAKDVPDHGFFLASDVCACYAHLDHLPFEILNLEVVQVDEVMGVPEVP